MDQNAPRGVNRIVVTNSGSADDDFTLVKEVLSGKGYRYLTSIDIQADKKLHCNVM